MTGVEVKLRKLIEFMTPSNELVISGFQRAESG